MQLRSSIATHKRGWPSLTHASSPHRWRVFSTLYNAVFLASIWRKIPITLKTLLGASSRPRVRRGLRHHRRTDRKITSRLARLKPADSDRSPLEIENE